MKILHVINDLTAGGAQTLVGFLAENTLPMDTSHLAVLLCPDVLSQRMASVFESVTYLGGERRPTSAIRCVARLSRLIGELQPDILHSHLDQADLVTILANHDRIPHLSTVHNSQAASQHLMSNAVRISVRLLAHRLDAVVACDTSAEGYVRRAFPSFEPLVIENGVRVPAHAPPSARGKFFLSLAGFRQQKAHDVMLAAFGMFQETHHDWRLVLAGENVTSTNPRLRHMINARVPFPNTVDALGQVSNPDGLLNSASALLISSDFEGLPMAGLEAAVQGTPVIATDVGGCRNLVVDDRFLVPARRPELLARAMCQLACLHEREYAILAERTRIHVAKRFDAKETARKYAELYRQLRIQGRYDATRLSDT